MTARIPVAIVEIAGCRSSVPCVRARDLMEDFPLVGKQTDALAATRLLVERGLPGLVVLDSKGLPLVVLPGSQVLRFALPEYVEDEDRKSVV